MSQEQRKHPRFPFKRTLTIFAQSPQLGKTIEYDATGINLSRGGILLESRADFAEGTRCTLTFHDLQQEKVTRTGMIRRVEAAPGMQPSEAMLLYGIEFDETLSEDALKTMVAAPD